MDSIRRGSTLFTRESAGRLRAPGWSRKCIRGVEKMMSVQVHWARKAVPAVLAAVLACLAASSVFAQTGGPEEIARQYVDARNRGDVEGAFALMAPGGTFQGAGQCAQAPCSGDALKAQLQREVGLHISISVTSAETEGNTSKLHLQVTNDRIKQCGVERVVSTETYTVVDGKITSIVAVIDQSDPQSARFLACPPPTQPPAPGAPSTGSGLADGETTSWPFGMAAVAIALGAVSLGLWVRKVKR
jgi:hypothetical protein